MKIFIVTLSFLAISALGVYTLTSNKYKFSEEGKRAIAYSDKSSELEVDGDRSVIEEINETIFAISTEKDIDNLIKKVDAELAERPMDATLLVYSAIISPLKVFKSFGWRVLELDAPFDFWEIMSVAELREVGKNLDRWAPHFRPLFYYLLQGADHKNISQDRAFSDFQRYYLETIYPELNKSIQKLSKVAEGIEDYNVEIFEMNTALFLGTSKNEMINEDYKHLKFTIEHVNFLLSNFHRIQAVLTYIASYDFDALKAFRASVDVYNMGKTLLEGTFTNNDYKFLPHDFRYYEALHDERMKHYLKITHKKDLSKLFTLKNNMIVNLSQERVHTLAASLEHFRLANKYRIKAVDGLNIQKDYPSPQIKNLINAENYLSQIWVNKKTLKKRGEVLNSNGAYSFKDAFYTFSFNINFSSLFDPKNPAIFDLKKLMPTKANFAGRNRTPLERLKNQMGKTDSEKWLMSFEDDSPTSLPDYRFGQLFPNASSMQDLKAITGSLGRDNALPFLNVWLSLFF